MPVLVAGDRADFETLVQALTSRNEPVPIPPAMGACLVKGLNNWSRVAAYRAEWQAQHAGADDAAWSEEFQRLVPRKELYQDRLVILSTGPYSAVPAADVGLPDSVWTESSVRIRQEHELTHLFVHRVFGVMRTHVFDEIVADFVGLARAFGTYRPDLALRFLRTRGISAGTARAAGSRCTGRTRRFPRRLGPSCGRSSGALFMRWMASPPAGRGAGTTSPTSVP